MGATNILHAQYGDQRIRTLVLGAVDGSVGALSDLVFQRVDLARVTLIEQRGGRRHLAKSLECK